MKKFSNAEKNLLKYLGKIPKQEDLPIFKLSPKIFYVRSTIKYLHEQQLINDDHTPQVGLSNIPANGKWLDHSKYFCIEEIIINTFSKNLGAFSKGSLLVTNNDILIVKDSKVITKDVPGMWVYKRFHHKIGTLKVWLQNHELLVGDNIEVFFMGSELTYIPLLH